MEYFFNVNPNIIENEYLREPQIQAYYHVYEHFMEKNKDTDAIVILPTGCGKTGLMGILPYGICRGRVLIITPQLVIKDAVLDSLDPEYPLNFWLLRGVFDSFDDLPVLIEYEGSRTSDEILNEANIIVLNIQKLQVRLASSLINRVPPDFFDMIIIDEAHHSTATTWVDTLKYFVNAKVIKLTGTPWRTDRKKIGGEVVHNYSLGAAMANGYVKSLENFVYIPDKLYLVIDGDEDKKYTIDEIREMNLKDEDWINRSVAYSRECNEVIINKSLEILKAKKESGLPHKIIGVACSIDHAKQLREIYESKGYKVALVHSRLDKETKAYELNNIENNRVDVVLHVAMLGEGYDHPYLSIAVIFRPFKGLLPYAQFIGRVLRSIPLEEAKLEDDNIAVVVSHRDLGLDELWEYYRSEKKKAETIIWLKPEDKYIGRNIPEKTYFKLVGHAFEEGTGTIEVKRFIETELIKLREKRLNEEKKKVEELKKLVDLPEEELLKIVRKATSKPEREKILRPDKYVQRKRKQLDVIIKEEYVPELLFEFNIAKESNNLANCPLFNTRKTFWIPQRVTDNAAMLAIYLEYRLYEIIGCKRDNWEIKDYNRAEELLPEILSYVKKVLSSYLARR